MIPVLSLKKILIVRSDALGDMVLMLPSILAIRRHYPHLHITVLASAYNQGLLSHANFIDAIITDPYTTGQIRTRRDRWDFVKQLRQQNFDIVIHAYFKPNRVWATVLAGIPYQIGDKGQLGLWPLFRKHGVYLRLFDNSKHTVEYNFELLKPLGISLSDDDRLCLPVSSEQRENGRQLLIQAGWDQTSRIVGIHLGVGGGNKIMDPIKFAHFITLFQKSGIQFCMTGHSEREKQYRDQISKTISAPLIDLVGKTSIQELMGIIGHYALYVGVDTGPFHMAAALGVPQVAIFTSRRVKPTRWGPWRNRHLVIRESHHCPHFCPHEGCQLTVCTDAIQVQDMVKKAEILLAGGGISSRDAQLLVWFKSSLPILVFYDTQTKDAANAYVDTLVTHGFLASLHDIEKSNFLPLFVEKNAAIVHTFSHKKIWPIFWYAQKASASLFSPPLVVKGKRNFVSEQDTVLFYRKKFSEKLF